MEYCWFSYLRESRKLLFYYCIPPRVAESSSHLWKVLTQLESKINRYFDLLNPTLQESRGWMSPAVLFTFLQLLHTSVTHAIANHGYLKTPFFPICVLVGNLICDCPGSRVVCCCSNHKNTFSALSMLFQGVFLTLQWEKLLVPWTHPMLEIFCFKSGCCPLKAVQHLRSRLDFDFFASCLLGSPASLTCTSALTEPLAFPLPQGKAGLRRSKYLGTNKAEVLASCWWKPVCV